MRLVLAVVIGGIIGYFVMYYFRSGHLPF